ncbi:MAG: tail fiber domain-containing protein [Paludibacteraceae bacterium]|nr:tail fiber domain-containing protein [Paludibacteraceae bacterium]
MKKTLFLSAILLMSAGYASSQLKVVSDGKVGIAVGTSAPLSNLSVNTVGDSTAAVSVERNGSMSITEYALSVLQGNQPYLSSTNYGVKVFTDKFTSQTSAAIYASSKFAFDKCIGVKASAGNGAVIPSMYNGVFFPKAYGVYATAGNLASGYNYGVYGLLTGSNNGTGIFGGISEYNSAIPDKYAGYFYGQTKVNGNFFATTVTETSDERLKANITPIKQEALSVIGRLNPVQYNWQQIELEGEVNDSTNEKPKYFSPDIDFEQLHYGFLAQEVRELLPNIVNEDGNGFLGINYQEIIPLLVMAIQDLQHQVESLQAGEPIKRQMPEDNLSDDAVLYQNEPNPFDVATEIRYFLPADMQNAAIYIYDMNGTQIQKHSIAKAGEGSLTIQANELQAGMYLYSLIADGQVVGTKRMILTK